MSQFKLMVARYPRFFYFLKRKKLALYYRLKLPTDQDYHYFKRFDSGVFLDIGANCGQTAISVHNVNPRLRVVSFEPNPALEPYLKLVKSWLRDKFEYFLMGIGDEDCVRDFYIPKVKSSFIYGEGTFVKQELMHKYVAERIGNEFAIEKFKFEIRHFDRLNEELKLAPAFVKIDTQGYELNVVRGMTKTLNEHRPALLLEHSEEFGRIRVLLESLDYELRVYNRKSGTLQAYAKGHTNYFAVPKT